MLTALAIGNNANKTNAVAAVSMDRAGTSGVLVECGISVMGVVSTIDGTR